MHEHAAVQQECLIRQVRQCSEIMRRHEDRGPAHRHLTEEPGHRCFASLIDARKRLIQQHNLRPLRNTPGDECPFALATGQLPDLAVGEFGEFHAF